MLRTRTVVWAFIVIAVLALVSCVRASVSIASTRDPNFRGSVEPLAFAVVEGNTGEMYTNPLKEALERELQLRNVQGHVGIITGAEFNEEQALARIATGARGLVTIVPAGGTSVSTRLSQILYDVRAFALSPGTSDGVQVWRAKIDTRSDVADFQIRDRLRLFAKDLLDRMVKDGLLPATAMRIEKRR